MGLRDRLKETAKALLGRTEPARPASTPAPSSAAPSSAAPSSAAPSSAATAPKPAAAMAKPAPTASPTPTAKPAASPAAKPAAAGPVKVGDDVDGWRAVAPAARVTPEKPGTFPIAGGVIVAVFRHGGKLYAIDNACAHEDGPVGEGEVSGKCVKCPYHDWEYDFTTGACRTDPERALATYAVRESDGFIWVGARLTEGTGARGGDHNDGLETITR